MNYLSFERFTAAWKASAPKRVTGGGILREGRRFWSKKLARWVGRRGKRVRYFMEGTGSHGAEAMVFRESGRWIDNVPVVGRPVFMDGQTIPAEHARQRRCDNAIFSAQIRSH